MSKLAPNARILIVRLTAIGDVLHTLPVLNALCDGVAECILGLGG